MAGGTRGALLWCVALAVVALAGAYMLYGPRAAADAATPPTGTLGGRLVHPWDRTFTCDPPPAAGYTVAAPLDTGDAAFYGADRPACDGYVSPDAPRGPIDARIGTPPVPAPRP